MRIVGGRWRGRTITAPKGNATRPTTDRVREALFSALVARLGSDLGGGRVLDAFAGSGALGLEALSRGAKHVTFVEHDRRAAAALTDNLNALGGGKTSNVVTGDVFSLAGRGIGGPFTLILLDPPYTLDGARTAGLLDALAASGSLAEGAFVTWEHGRGQDISWPEGFVPVTRKRYGSTEIDFAVWERGEAE